MGVERLTKREAVGLFGGEKWEKALNRLIQLSKGAPIRLISGAQLLVREADGETSYEIRGTEDQVRIAWDHTGGRQQFAGPPD